MKRILLVEDDLMIGKSLTLGLRPEGYEVILVKTVAEAQKVLGDEEFDLVLLDVNLPDGNGFTLCSEIRSIDSRLPILMLTARTDETSAVRGLKCGADDYLRKPVGLMELVARIERTLGTKDELSYANLKMSMNDRSVKAGTVAIDLSRREFDILAVLMRNATSVVSRDQILDCIDRDGNIVDRSIDPHLSRIRAKLSAANVTTVRISSVYGLGYRLEQQE